jgi:predicted acylesterase/phospholipase RssA/CRP-like cAMP-binding protein
VAKKELFNQNIGNQREYNKGSIIMRQGQLKATFQAIISGNVDVFIGIDPRIKIATLGPGDFFGEMACLTGDPVSATVEAVEDVKTLEMDKEGLLELIDNDQTIRHRLINALANRVRQTNVRVEQENLRAQVMAQVICREGESRHGELVGQSSAMKSLRAEIKMLGADYNPVAVEGERGSGKKHIAARLHYDSPRREGILLFVNGHEFTSEFWDKQVKAAHAGTVVLSQADILPPESIRSLLANSQDTKIIITGERLPDIPGLSKLTAPPLRDHKDDIPALARSFFLRSNTAESMQTLSADALRRLTAYPYLTGNVDELFQALEQALVFAAGMPIQAEHLRLGSYMKKRSRPKIGLALGGGAVRGVAHVGVMKVLEQEGIPIDIIAGSSAGSLVGGLYASGMETTEMEHRLPLLRWSKLVRPVWPRLAVCENSRMGPWLEGLSICRDFSELRIPFACVAADLLTGEAVILRSGCVATAIRASTAIPLMMKPVHHQGRVLVDGGVVHKIPAVLARSMGADLVIAVDVAKPPDIKSQPRNLFDSLFGVLDVMSQHLVEDELEWADIILRPQAPVSGYSFKNSPLFFEQGEKVARENIDHIRKRIGELAEDMA